VATTLITPDMERAVIAPPLHQAKGTISPAPFVATGTTADWRQALPRLVGERLTLRGLQASDAGSLLSLLTTDEVSRFLSPPPTTMDGFERFIAWTNRKRQEGSYLCFGVVPRGMEEAVGVFQLRALDAAFNAAEWGFALGRPFWGTGLFVEAATHTLDFAFGSVGVQRLEARSALANGRGNAALRKIGAVHEAVLRRSFHKDGRVHDQILWSILDSEWFATRSRVLGLPTQPAQRWH
jgi:[ribosomal protein S5]-alanine N-acetyltransferase